MGKKKKVIEVVEVEEKSRGGCLKPILIFFLIVIALAAISPNRSNSNSSSSKPNKTVTATPTHQPTNTPKPTRTPQPTKTPIPTATPTPKPTKTPKPTATPVPDFSAMNVLDAAKSIVAYYCDDMEITSIEKTNNYITIILHTDSFLTNKMFVRSCCGAMLNVSENLFENKDFDELNMKFTTGGRDQYGNEKIVTAVTIRLTRDTASKINYDYMITNLGTTTKGFLQITDSYFVHPDLNSGVY